MRMPAMDFFESRREATEHLVRYAASQGVDLSQFRDEYDVFANQRRWIDFWMDGESICYHLRGEIGKLPTQFAGSQSSFRGVWDEAGSIKNISGAFELFRSWLIDAKEVDELT